ncbi:MAG TPA: cytochrome c3 family protein, partial [Candidatus Baltobacteraceae bacterium]|nr:cytochrome c3 family protein [Candidatus Baltobacteraceae bacterium]
NTCADCHDDITKKKDVHQPVADGDCLACHAPHASNNKHLVKKTGATLCWDCHDNFLTKAKFTHDAVENCTDCHNPHSTAENKLLKKNVNSLCADCHEQKDIAAVKAHANIGTQSCIVCHDPHVGTDKNLLKPAAKISGATTGGPP